MFEFSNTANIFDHTQHIPRTVGQFLRFVILQEQLTQLSGYFKDYTGNGYYFMQRNFMNYEE